jgi:cytochrome P450
VAGYQAERDPATLSIIVKSIDSCRHFCFDKLLDTALNEGSFMAIEFPINPMTEEFRTHCASHYSTLLRERPVAKTELDQWLLCKHADVLRVLSDHANFQRPSDWSNNRKPEGPLRQFGENNMIGMNPPQHTRFRQCAARAFTRKTVEAMAPKIEQLVDTLLDNMAEKKGGDFITEFAFPLPIYVVCELLGISQQDHDLFARCTAEMLGSLEMAATPEAFDKGTEAARILFSYCKDVATYREKHMGDDLLSLLIHKEREDRMTREEVIWVAVTMLIAGHETTTHMLGNGLLALIRHPSQYELLVNNPDLATNTAEETLRFDPTLYVLFRETVNDVDIGGHHIPAGSFLIPSLYAANRDPEVFENPDTFDIRRPNADKHLAFAAGRNLCLGHALARMEGRIAFSKLFKRVGNFQLAGEPVPRNGLMFRGNTSLPMTWEAL